MVLGSAHRPRPPPLPHLEPCIPEVHKEAEDINGIFIERVIRRFHMRNGEPLSYLGSLRETQIRIQIRANQERHRNSSYQVFRTIEPNHHEGMYCLTVDYYPLSNHYVIHA